MTEEGTEPFGNKVKVLLLRRLLLFRVAGRGQV